MAQFRINITKRKQTRRQRDGSIKEYDRYVLQYRDPKTGKRVQQFYSRQKEAYDAQRQIVLDHEQGSYLGPSKHKLDYIKRLRYGRLTDL